MKNDQLYERALAAFEARAGVSFLNRALIRTAFTHRSYLNEYREDGEHNERLEFLGDAVLELAVTDFLFQAYPDLHEGQLTAYRAALVNASFLSSVADHLDMNECLRLSKGEAKDTGRARATILANTFEAVVGALYLDQGYASAEAFIRAHVTSRSAEVVASGAWRDPKSAFQELAQGKYGVTPRYDTVRSSGPDHDKRFVVSVSVEDVVVAEGEGGSKQEAETNAATAALESENASKS